jgi:hypothetical protein
MENTNTKNTATQTLTGFKMANGNDAVALLREFYLQVKKELKQNDKVIVSANCDEKCNVLEFTANNFNLSIQLKERN